MKNLFTARILFVFLLLVLFRNQASTQPDTVKIGAFINDIYDINLAEKSFSTTFWVWFNYTNPELTPLETLEIPTAKELNYELEFTEQKNGIYWSGKQVHAVIKKDWDVRRFPFDKQVMTIDLEESDQDTGTMVYLADTENTKLDTGLVISNWQIERFELTTKARKYDTTYGDPDLTNGSAYAHATLKVFIKRKSWGLFFSLFTGLYVSFFISTLVFFIDPIHVDPRFGLSVGAMFAAVGNKYIVDSILPQSTTFTLVDKLHIITYVYLLLCIVLSVISLRLWQKGKEAKSIRFDRRAYFLILVSYLLINTALVYLSTT
ncbi:MAG: hypothetical protein EP344_13020 [Bacteroidetes bacterium]|nr:MAG: hypothetical protein EP344_13020 [Bacteroidota bacterium]